MKRCLELAGTLLSFHLSKKFAILQPQTSTNVHDREQKTNHNLPTDPSYRRPKAFNRNTEVLGMPPLGTNSDSHHGLTCYCQNSVSEGTDSARGAMQPIHLTTGCDSPSSLPSTNDSLRGEATTSSSRPSQMTSRVFNSMKISYLPTMP